MGTIVDEICAAAIARDKKLLCNLPPEGLETGNDLITAVTWLMEKCYELGFEPICWLIKEGIDPGCIVCGVALSSANQTDMISILKYARECTQVSIEEIMESARAYGKDLEFCSALKTKLEKYFLALDELSAQRSEFNQAVAKNQLLPVNVYVIQSAITLRLWSHIFILLAQCVDEKTYYAMVDTNSGEWEGLDWHASKQPCSRGFFVGKLKKMIDELKADGTCAMETGTCLPAYLTYTPLSIPGNIFEMKRAWEEYRISHPYQRLTHNCADVTEWFLEKYANFPKSRACVAPVTCNPVMSCCWLPSFFQCCTLPDRVMDHITYTKEQPSREKYRDAAKPVLRIMQ